MDHVEAVFGAGGLLAARLPGYEARAGQLSLARAVDGAMREGRHVLAEAPCGTGKSLAYGVPAVFHARTRGRRVAIATANIALQEQLVGKDLPFLREVLPWPFTFAILKGRANYLCPDRRADTVARRNLDGLSAAERRQAEDILAWSETTVAGDVSELPFVPPARVWSRFSVSADECRGEACALVEQCPYEHARARAWTADIVVTNYHLLFAHLALREQIGQDVVLPPFDLLVCDEAHEAADIARDFHGFSVSEMAIRRLAGRAEDAGHERLADLLRREAGEFFHLLACHARSKAYAGRLRRAGVVSAEALREALGSLVAVAEARAEDERLSRKARAEARTTSRLAETAAARLIEATEIADPNKVYWIEIDAKERPHLKAKPIDVGPILRTSLFERTGSVVLVSATLATGGRFDFVRRELGVPEETAELVAETPFVFETQALLIVPEDLPDPREPGFPEAVASVMKHVIDACGGRTLGLFTSYRVMNAVHEHISGNGHRVLRQGDLPRQELTRIFKDDVASVLLGTDSFWTGIDVPGEALTALVIDKLPFPHPEDPLIDAICERNPAAFRTCLLPRAIITLRQGVGRLIRTRADHGVVVLLDRRVADKAYGREILRSLPPMRSSRRLTSIPRFLEEAGRACAC